MKMFVLDDNGQVVFETDSKYHKFPVSEKEMQFKTLVFVKSVYKYLSTNVIRIQTLKEG